ncbi:MAG: VOC family protein [Pseudomonadota bacterium]
MSHPITGIDHAFLLVRDLDEAARSYARLGFTVSPRGLHSEHKGTANHTIMLDGDYFELLGIVREVPGNAEHRTNLAKGEGLNAIACQVGDTRAAVQALAELGLTTTEPVDFERPVTLPGGGSGRAAFTVAAFDSSVVPHGYVFMCQHHTRETVWLPELTHHANGARTLAGIVAAVDDPAAIANGYARLYAAGTTTPIVGGLEVWTGNTPIQFVTPSTLSARYPDITVPTAAYAVLRIRAADLTKARDVVAAGGIAAHDTADGFAVAPETAAGAILEFVA